MCSCVGISDALGILMCLQSHFMEAHLTNEEEQQIPTAEITWWQVIVIVKNSININENITMHLCHSKAELH